MDQTDMAQERILMVGVRMYKVALCHKLGKNLSNYLKVIIVTVLRKFMHH